MAPLSVALAALARQPDGRIALLPNGTLRQRKIDEVVHLLEAAGHPLDHWGLANPYRRNVYVIAPEGLQFEFVEYLSADVRERNAYAA